MTKTVVGSNVADSRGGLNTLIERAENDIYDLKEDERNFKATGKLSQRVIANRDGILVNYDSE